MAARTYQTGEEAYAFLASPAGRVRAPEEFQRHVRHASLATAAPFRRLDRRGVLALAFLFALFFF